MIVLPMPELEVRDLGLLAYEEAYAIQKELVARKRSDPGLPDVLLLLEHPDIYTSGRKSKGRSADGAVSVERGGEDTFHNPGQLVAYPILSLGEAERDLHRVLRLLEQVVIGVLGDFGVSSERRAGATGVWVRGELKKIASLGIAVSGWVTYHGVALNVANDLAGFKQINPCGFEASVMTSMSERLGDQCPSLSEVKQAFVGHFQSEFSRGPIALPTSALLG